MVVLAKVIIGVRYAMNLMLGKITTLKARTHIEIYFGIK
jgi:hypothetical protein